MNAFSSSLNIEVASANSVIENASQLHMKLSCGIKQRLENERKGFEYDISNSTHSTDPINSWYRYLEWQKMNVNNKDFESFLEKYLKKFLHHSQYKNDPRYVNAWLDMAQASCQPEETFVYMRSNGIGVKCASFYIAWADEYEKEGSIDQALALYECGMQQNAQPIETISKLKIEFEERISVHLKKQSTVQSSMKKRSIFKNTKDTVPSVLPLQQNNRNNEFKQPLKLSCSSKVSDKENLAENLHQNLKLSENLTHENQVTDDCTAMDTKEAGKPDYPFDDILAVEEPFPYQESINHRQIRSAYGESIQNVLPMYPMKKVYSQLGEFQLEEVIAVKWRKKNRITTKVLQTVENVSLNSTVQKYSEELVRAKEHVEAKLQRRQNQMSTMLEVLSSELGIKVPQTNEEMTMDIQSVCSQLRQMNVDPLHANSAAAKVNELIGSMIENTSVWDTNESVKDVTSSCNVANSRLELSPTHGNHSCVDDRRGKGSFSINPSTPTLCTKEAMGDIMDMFQIPLMGENMNQGNPCSINEVDTSNLSLLVDNNPKGESQAFQVFDERSSIVLPTNKSKINFSIFCDGSKESADVDMSQDNSSKTQLEPFKVFEDEPSAVNHIDCRSSKQFLNKIDQPLETSMFKQSVESKTKPFQIFDENVNEISSRISSDRSLVQSKEKVCQVVDEMSETIVAGQDNFQTSAFNEKESLVSLPFDNRVVAESTSYKQLLVNDNINNQNDVMTKKVKNLSPILEGSNETSSSPGNCESLFPHKDKHSNDAVSEVALLTSIDLGKTVNNDLYDSIDMDIQLKHSNIVDAPSNNHSELLSLSHLNLSSCNASVRPHHPSLNIIDDPWDETSRRKLAQSSLSQCSYILSLKQKAPCMRKNFPVNVANRNFSVIDLVGRGGFAKVYLVSSGSNNLYTIKCESPPCEWETVIMQAAQERLQVANHPMLSNIFINVNLTIIFTDASWIISEYVPYGTLLDFVNNTSKDCKKSPLQYHQLAVQVLELVDALHSIDVIHGDVKPDNFLVCSDYRSAVILKEVPRLKLIDFGRSIDMTVYPVGTAFTKSCGTSAFVCTQMKMGLPWNYHTDYYGLAGTIYLLMTNSYMKVVQGSDGRWKPSGKLPRWADDEWGKMFASLLNHPTPSNTFQPSYSNSPLPQLIRGLKRRIAQMEEEA